MFSPGIPIKFDVPNKKTHFYKYVSREAALAILTNGTLQWSSPLTFSDPLDVFRDAYAGLEIYDIDQELRKLCLKKMVGADSAEKIFPSLTPSSIDEIRQRPSHALIELNRRERRYNLAKLRILCLTTKADSGQMWSNYAEEFKGAVLRDCLKNN